ncbi:MAG: prolipoprotein diacylglyceryl transferase [Phycisphaeraceae bacterium]|nr:prolipoprotein diacylglyceryl transferase [Phycisphaeraceae bacterium]MCW5755093.1 prolipoprotein diacylglyceryl transferase [Phycisphaeraceae bacterium]
MTLAAWLHNLDPVLWQPFSWLTIRWYGIAYLLGFFVAYLLLRWLSRRGATPIPRVRAADVIITAALAAVVGGRLGYVLFYKPQALVTFYAQFPYWDILKLWGGGMASHGGMIGVLIAAWIVSRGFPRPDGTREGRTHVLHVLDRLALIAPPGLLLGRLANFVNGELLGRIVAPAGAPAPWWAVKYPQEVLERPLELSQEQWIGLSRAMGVPLLDADNSSDRFDAAYQQLVQALHEGSAHAATVLHQYLNARHPSQLYQAAAEGVVLGVVVWVIAYRPRRAGVTAAWFLMVYGALRIVTEFWRLPDSHLLTARIAGLSRGQWLSATMIVMGAWLLWHVHRKGTPMFKGWGRQEPEEASAGATSAPASAGSTIRP